MKDVTGKEILCGMTVESVQPSGGLLSPAPAQIGIVEETKDAFDNETLQIRYRKEGQDFDRFILLEGKINRIV